LAKAAGSSAMECTGPMPMAPWPRAMDAMSTSGSIIFWPIHLFSTGRLRAMATRS